MEGWDWNSSKKLVFANDFLNHVAAVTYVNPTLKKTYAPFQIAVSASVAVDRISIKSEKSSDCEEIFSLE